MRNKPKILLFDVDGVLAIGDHWGKHLERDYGITKAMTQGFFTNKFGACIIGKADLKEELAPYIQQWGWRGTVDDLIAYWFRAEHNINEPLLAYIQTLRGQGTACYVATMQEQYRTAYILQEMGFEKQFDGIFSSAFIGYKKTQPEFYAHILKKLEVTHAQEVLFWDDSPANVATAHSVGLQAEVYSDFADFTEKMRLYSDK